MTKTDLRRRMKAVLGSMEARALADGGAAAARRLETTEAWKAAELVLAFLSMPGEIDTEPLIGAARRAGKAVAVPRIEGDLLRFHLVPADAGPLPRDRWGIPVPDPSWPPAPVSGAPGGGPMLIVVPGLAFDRRGNRLGRGKGFYDRFLAGLETARHGRFTAIGLCLSVQVVEEVPTDAQDRPVDGVATDAETMMFSAFT
jgi:5-formyltetrahydrofolate cyclo-ligase